MSRDKPVQDWVPADHLLESAELLEYADNTDQVQDVTDQDRLLMQLALAIRANAHATLAHAQMIGRVKA